jgi:hypothetical protein
MGGGIPAKDFLCCVEKAIGTLPEETADEIQQETVRIIKGSRQPKDNLTGAKWRALRSLKANASLTVLPTDKGNATMVLGTSDYNRKIATLLQDKAYAKLKWIPLNPYSARLFSSKSPHFLRRCASKYDHRVPGHLGFMGSRRFTNLVCH